MIVEFNNLKNKNIKLLEELARLKEELQEVQHNNSSKLNDIYLSLIAILDTHSAEKNSSILNAIYAILDNNNIKKMTNPSLKMKGMCVTTTTTEFSNNHTITNVLQDGYLINGEILRPFLVEIA